MTPMLGMGRCFAHVARLAAEAASRARIETVRGDTKTKSATQTFRKNVKARLKAFCRREPRP